MPIEKPKDIPIILVIIRASVPIIHLYTGFHKKCKGYATKKASIKIINPIMP